MDETPEISRLLDEGKRYSLSRPRRFGEKRPLVEESTRRSRLQSAVRPVGRVCPFEFKAAGQAGADATMAQSVPRSMRAVARPSYWRG